MNTKTDFIRSMAAALAQNGFDNTPHTATMLWVLTDLAYPCKDEEKYIQTVLDDVLGNKCEYSTGDVTVSRVEPDPHPMLDSFAGDRYRFQFV